MRSILLFAALSLGNLFAADDYTLGPDSFPKEGVPKGEVTQHQWRSHIFPGTERDYWVYVPRQYTPEKPAAVMIFQDGGGYINPNGSYRVPTVFDNLIHAGEMPVTIGIFINPGVVPPLSTNALPRFNRSFEYDGLGDRYARFLLEEILPEIGKKYNLSTNAHSRAIGGASSGAICAFTAAWERPDAFGRVFSTIGTYVGLRGGNDYPTLVRKFEPKPIRVFLQDGSNDLNIYGGNWFIANEDMLSALQFSGYAVTNVWGDGGHNGKHGGAIFPDAMRWLWKDAEQPIARGLSRRHPLNEILVEGEGWQEASRGHRFTKGAAVNARGEVFFSDVPLNRIHRIDPEGKVTQVAANTGGVNGLGFNEKGDLIACANDRKQILKYAPDGTLSVVASDVPSNNIAVRHGGDFFITDPANRKIWHCTADGQKRTVDEGIRLPNGIVLSPDQSLLLVGDTGGQMVYSFQVLPNGSLTNKQPYYHLHLPDTAMQSGADGMAVDAQGRLYVATPLGIQVCDQAGRVNAIIEKPQRASISALTFGGPDMDTLFVTSEGKVFKRKVKVKGAPSFQPPIKPAPPRL